MILRPTWIRVMGSFLSAIVFGGFGTWLYLVYVGFRNTSEFGPLPAIVAYALCWPAVLLANLHVGLWFYLLVLSLYYYLIISLIVVLRNRWHPSDHHK
jgi:hypothetical protein